MTLTIGVDGSKDVLKRMETLKERTNSSFRETIHQTAALFKRIDELEYVERVLRQRIANLKEEIKQLKGD